MILSKYQGVLLPPRVYCDYTLEFCYSQAVQLLLEHTSLPQPVKLLPHHLSLILLSLETDPQVLKRTDPKPPGKALLFFLFSYHFLRLLLLL